jgi:hypothetical protein
MSICCLVCLYLYVWVHCKLVNKSSFCCRSVLLLSINLCLSVRWSVIHFLVWKFVRQFCLFVHLLFLSTFCFSLSVYLLFLCLSTCPTCLRRQVAIWPVRSSLVRKTFSFPESTMYMFWKIKKEMGLFLITLTCLNCLTCLTCCQILMCDEGDILGLSYWSYLSYLALEEVFVRHEGALLFL